MLSLSLADISCAALGTLFIYGVWCSIAPRSGPPYPPGPKHLLILGNILQWPKYKEWETFGRWGNMYGNLVMVNLLGQRVLIINSARAALDLFEKKSTIYSDRPSMRMCGELCGFDRTMGLTQYGDRMREMRKICHATLTGKENIVQNIAVQEQETRRFLRRVMGNSGSTLQQDIRILTGAIILKITYGYQVSEGPTTDPLVQLVEQTVDDFAKTGVPGAYLVDRIPILRYVPEWCPGVTFKTTARVARQRLDAAVNLPYDAVKAQMADGTALPSIASQYMDATHVSQQIVKDTLYTMYAAGGGTVESSLIRAHIHMTTHRMLIHPWVVQTASAEYSFFLAMTLHPEVQTKAQAEIDRAIGHDRLPTLDDRERLPYVDAIVKEVFRWSPVTPQGIPHKVQEDDIHNGYFIPKTRYVFRMCGAGLLHDEETYKNAELFRPERFSEHPVEQDPREYLFGFGRRICAGMQLADASLFLAIALTLSVFEIQPATDLDVKDALPIGGGIVNHPRLFPCVVKPRSAHTEELINAREAE